MFSQPTNVKKNSLPAPFWVLWALEVWERFGFYGIQVIIAVFFVNQAGYSQKEAIYIYGSFSALLFASPVFGGWIGDKFLGAKRTVAIGSSILFLSYTILTFADVIIKVWDISLATVVIYALSGIAVGVGLFKANPPSLISKLYKQSESALDSALTLYYMSTAIGAMLGQYFSPVIAHKYGYLAAFSVCSVGMLLGLISYAIFYKKLQNISTDAGKKPFSFLKSSIIIFGSLIMIGVFGFIMPNIVIVNIITTIIVCVTLIYFFYQMYLHTPSERTRMWVALILMGQGVLFYVLFQQMPTSLNFYAINNVYPNWLMSGEQWQSLNAIAIILVSPFLARFFKGCPCTHATKFCIGMSCSAVAFLILYFPQFFASAEGMVSGWWLFANYFLQATGEIFIGALGISMVASLLPKSMSGFGVGMWYITVMIAGPIGAWVGALTAPQEDMELAKIEALAVYSNVFLKLGIFVAIIAIVMWCIRGFLNCILISTEIG